jgi:fructosamine-3-kinase
MTLDNKQDRPKGGSGPIRWLSNARRTSIEETVSEYKRRAWNIRFGKDLRDLACHRCAIVSDGSFAVFFKYSEGADAKRQFEIELSDLQTLSKKTGVLVPRPIDIVRAENGWLLIMEALETIQRESRQWRQIGATLACIHRVKGDSCGFERHGFLGPLIQDNTPTQNWATFYRERRLLPRLRVAIDSGNIPASVVSRVEMLTRRLPELCGPEITPSLLHGDAQQNNFISTADGIFVIDPAVYYGNPEMDLALIDSFQPVPDAVFDGYRDEMPIDSGFFERRNLWRVPLYLAAVAIEGSIHLNRLTDALGRYL